MKNRLLVVASVTVAFLGLYMLPPFTGACVASVGDPPVERHMHNSQELDTFVWTVANTTSDWEIAIPAGTYYVTLTCGDPKYLQGPHRVSLSGNATLGAGATWIDVIDDQAEDTRTVASEFYTVIEEPVTVQNVSGTEMLTLRVGGTSAATLINFVIISSSTETPPPLPLSVNFTSNRSPNGWQEDTGAAYGPHGDYTYGWTPAALDGANNGVADRNGYNPDVELDTFAWTLNSMTTTWELALPIGTYYVTLASGDSRWEHGPHRVIVEGITIVDDKYTGDNQFVTVTSEIISVFDGNLTVELGGGLEDVSQINYITVSADRPTVTFPVRINFEPGFATRVQNYSPDMGALYKNVYGYGWGDVLDCRDNYTQAMQDAGLDPLLGTVVGTYAGHLTSTWNYELGTATPGNYYVFSAHGNPTCGINDQNVWVEGVHLIDDLDTADGDPYAEFLEIYNQQVWVTDDTGDGSIDLTYVIGEDIVGKNTGINYVVINNVGLTAWTFPIQINFQPGWSPAYSDWIIDSGGSFDVVTRYGWDRSNMQVRDYNSAYATDQRWDTFVGTPNVGDITSWKIVLDNGNYHVSMGLGSPEWPTGPYTVILESGEAAERTWNFGNVNPSNPANQVGGYLDPEYEITTVGSPGGPITVTDGEINLQIGHQDGGNAINWIQIEQAT